MEKDENGYPVGKIEHSNLIHRQIAYSEIYLKNRKKYPKKFSEYVVHHINTNKEDFSVRNLYLCSKEEHNAIHEEQKKNLKRFKTKKELDEFLEVWNDRRQKKLNYGDSYSKNFYVPKEVYQQPKIIETRNSKIREKKKIRGIIKIILILITLILMVWLLSSLFDREKVSGESVYIGGCHKICNTNMGEWMEIIPDGWTNAGDVGFNYIEDKNILFCMCDTPSGYMSIGEEFFP